MASLNLTKDLFIYGGVVCPGRNPLFTDGVHLSKTAYFFQKVNWQKQMLCIYAKNTPGLSLFSDSIIINNFPTKAIKLN